MSISDIVVSFVSECDESITKFQVKSKICQDGEIKTLKERASLLKKIRGLKNQIYELKIRLNECDATMEHIRDIYKS